MTVQMTQLQMAQMNEATSGFPQFKQAADVADHDVGVVYDNTAKRPAGQGLLRQIEMRLGSIA
ncbi:hypothetical protein [Roseovarius sp. EL26]|uniref:hypothetical protein n=1 Tax=Roseovarius sp. EL26 TaxID=2126672 RepID=UPI0013C3F236|nr:hypothetical protein [Roseovarius sp. EL26]